MLLQYYILAISNNLTTAMANIILIEVTEIYTLGAWRYWKYTIQTHFFEISQLVSGNLSVSPLLQMIHHSLAISMP